MHSLRVTADGTYLTEDFPGSMMSMHWRISESSIIVGHYIDMDGVNLGTRQLLIVGPYDDSNGKRHGFLFTRRVGVGAAP